jgi:hypothetical protein
MFYSSCHCIVNDFFIYSSDLSVMFVKYIRFHWRNSVYLFEPTACRFANTSIGHEPLFRLNTLLLFITQTKSLLLARKRYIRRKEKRITNVCEYSDGRSVPLFLHNINLCGHRRFECETTMFAVLLRMLSRSCNGNDSDLSLALKPIHACPFQTFFTCVKQ